MSCCAVLASERHFFCFVCWVCLTENKKHKSMVLGLWRALKEWVHDKLELDDLEQEQKQNNNNANKKSETKVIVVLNSDLVRTAEGDITHEQLPTISDSSGNGNGTLIGTDEETSALIPGASTHNIGLRLAHFPREQLSVIGQVDSNLLSFVTNVLLSHNVKSIVMMKKSDGNFDALRQALDDEKTPEEQQGILVYGKSRAEEKNLEERF